MRLPVGPVFRTAALGTLLLAATSSISPAAAADVTLSDVRLGSGAFTVRAPSIVVRGTASSEAELRRALDPASSEPVADRVRRIDASAIEIGELTTEVTTGPGRQVTIYRNLRFEKVGGGRIGTVSAESGSVATEQPGKSMTGEFGRMVLQDADLGAAIALFGDTGGVPAPAGAAPTPAAPRAARRSIADDASKDPGPPAAAPPTITLSPSMTPPSVPAGPMRRLYGAYSIEGFSLRESTGAVVKIGRVAGTGVSARALAGGWIGTMNVLAATPDINRASPEARRRSVDALTDIFDAFDLGAMEVSDVSLTVPNAGGGRIAKIGFSSGPRGADMTVEGLEGGSGPAGRIRLASMSFGGLSMKPILGAIREDAVSGGFDKGAAAMRRLAEIIGSIRISGFELTTPEGGSGAPGMSQPAAQTYGLGSFELATDKPVNGLPSDIRFGFRNLTLSVPANPTDEAMRQLATLGFTRLDASFTTNLGWNEPGQEIVVREISAESAGMGSVVARAVVGNVSRDVFNPDTAVASVAFLGASAKSAEILLENRGLFERIVAREAGRQKRSPEDVRREYGMAAAVGIPAILGNSPQAKALSQAVARFVAKPGRLLLRAKARQPGGFGAADFAARPDPASVLEALEVTAETD